MRFKYILLLFVTSSALTAQSGNISGNITDASTGEPLIGANVFLEGTSLGAATDFEGNYFIVDIPVGSYTIIANYIGYDRLTIENVIVKDGIATIQNISLSSGTIELQAVDVQAEKKLGGDAEALEAKEKAVEIVDNISSDQISKAGDSDAADAVRRVTGVTVTDGKYLVVRGLGDRYSTAQLNSVGMPSPEAEKRSVPLNLFSTALIAGIDVAKSYRPDLPGTFGGGNVNIKTKLYPSRTLYKIKFGSGLNSNLMPGSDFISNMDGSGDFFGYDHNKVRDIPSQFNDQLINFTNIPNDFRTDLASYYVNMIGDTVWYDTPERKTAWYSEAFEKNRSMPNIFKNSLQKSSLPKSISLTYGTKIDLNPDFEMGYLFDGNFSGKHKHNSQYIKRYAGLNDPDNDGESILRNSYLDLEQKTYEYNTNLGFNASAGLTYKDLLKFGIRNVYTHTSKDYFARAMGESGELSKTILEDGSVDEMGLLFSQRYNEKAINLTTFSVEGAFLLGSFFGNLENEFDLKVTAGQSNMYEPFVAKAEYEYDPNFDQYTIYARNGSRPGEYYGSYGDEEINGLIFNYGLSSRFGKIKFGVRIDDKKRDFSRRWIYSDWSDMSVQFDRTRISIDEDSPNEVLSEEFWGSFDGDQIQHGLLFVEQTSGFDGYKATENIDAAYIMYDQTFFDKLQLSVGARREKYIMSMDPYNPVTSERPSYRDSVGNPIPLEIDNDDSKILPAFILNYSLTDKSKVRSSYSKTLARPQFREYAPYTFSEFLGADISVGYPFLKNTELTSFDLRYEYYPKGIELISVGIFKKDFKNPIEESLLGVSGLAPYKSWQNSDYAHITGIELEYRKNLDFIPSRFGFLFLNTNLSVSSSEVAIPEKVYVFVQRSTSSEIVPFANPVTERTRPLQGQSNLVYNTSLNYNNQSGYELNLAYNSFSKRLVSISGDIPGHFWELPFHSLNITGSKKIGPFKASFKIQNVLGESVIHAHDFRGDYYNTKEFNPGRNLSISLQYNN